MKCRACRMRRPRLIGIAWCDSSVQSCTELEAVRRIADATRMPGHNARHDAPAQHSSGLPPTKVDLN